MKDQLVASLEARLRRFLESGDASGIVEEAAAEEIAELISRIGRGAQGPDEFAGPIEVRVLQLLAWLLLNRHRVLPAGDGRRDLETALAILVDLHSANPDYVPPTLRDLVELTRRNPYDNPVTRLDEANANFRAYEETRQLTALDNTITSTGKPWPELLMITLSSASYLARFPSAFIPGMNVPTGWTIWSRPSS